MPGVEERAADGARQLGGAVARPRERSAAATSTARARIMVAPAHARIQDRERALDEQRELVVGRRRRAA